MTAPTLKNQFDVSSWMYGNSDNNGFPALPANLDTFAYSPGQFDSGLDTNTGFHGASFITRGPDPYIIIGFEGTDAAGLFQRQAFLEAQIQADLTLFLGYRPEALRQALTFAEIVIEAAAEQGIPRDRVVVTGHSLGAAEAAYVSTQLGLAGVTFAAPGLNRDYIVNSGENLTNYVAFGDPVGNYSATPANYEGAFLFDLDIHRVGAPTYIDRLGNIVGQIERQLLIEATENFNRSSGNYNPVLGLLEVGGLAAAFHRLTFYGDQFSPSLNPGAPVQVDGSRIIDGVEYLQFYGDLIDRSGLVSDAFYNIYNDDVRMVGVDPEAHYRAFGWREGRDPNPFFSTVGYRAANPDVASAATDPLAEYHASGWRSGDDPSANFDTELYLVRNPDVRAANIDPLAHYLDFGRYEAREVYSAIGRSADIAAAGGFDAEYYLLSNPDVARAAISAGGDSFAFARQHFTNFGVREGRDANAVFDTDGYLNTYADVRAAGLNPLTHYMQFGYREGRDPSVEFDTTAYLAAYPDLQAAGVNPMVHYLQFGLYEGRSAFADGTFGTGNVG